MSSQDRDRDLTRGKLTMGKSFRITAVLAVACWIAVGAAVAQPARAQFGITEFGGSISTGSQFSRQAGAHPDFTTRLRFSSAGAGPDGQVKTVKVDLPPGLIGNATVASACTEAELVAGTSQGFGNSSLCPITSQIGYANVVLDEPTAAANPVPLYNLKPPADLPALFGFNYQGVIVKIEPHVRAGDYGISAVVQAISQARAVLATEVTFWGVPADPSHDSQRVLGDSGLFQVGNPSPAARLPLMTAPTSCTDTPLNFVAQAESWEDPGDPKSASFTFDLDGTPFIFEGCEALPFRPSVSVDPDSRAAAGPVGLDVDVSLPQSDDPGGLATADVRRTEVILPRGFSISPSAAAGLGACSTGQIGLGSNAPPTCPGSSSLGTVSIKTPLLEEELEGDVYLAKQRENPFGSLLAIYLAVKGPGFYLKLPGKVEADAQTGRLTTTFDETPQLPFEELKLSLRGGPAAPLVTPSACGTYEAHVEMTSWASPVPVSLDSPVTIDRGCGAGGFSPKLNAGTADPSGGSFSPFTLRVTQGEGESNLSRIDATLPPGLLAKLAGVPLCGDAQAATGSCPVGSQVGTATVGAGPGPNPIYVPEVGKAPTAVYLAGAYEGAPYSLVVKVPAQAGPFDLGTVVVRNALQIDPTTTQVTAESDPLPQILEGIPVSYRDVRVEINRNEFTVNPTNCSQFQVAATLTSSVGQTTSPKAPFAAANCERLAFKPTLALQMKGQTKRAGNPALTATLKAPPGQANIADTTVILPKTVFIDQRHVSNPCTRVQFNANACPPKSVLGTAVAYSPLLDKPLEGPVYFRSNGGERKLPDIVADLHGQIHVVLVGFIDSKKAGKGTSLVRTRFASVPDAPVSKFVLSLKGGKQSLIQNSANLCKAKTSAEVKMTGQNSKTNDFTQRIAVRCGKAKKKKQPKKH
jgi:hypothetical protein